MRDVGLASAELSIITDDRRKKAEAQIKYEKAIKELNDLLSPDPIYGKTGKIFKMWQQAEEMIFSISRADGKLSMNDLWRMNVYEFLRYKELLVKEIKLKTKKRE